MTRKPSPTTRVTILASAERTLGQLEEQMDRRRNDAEQQRNRAHKLPPRECDE
jgi:hypothetical protein